MRKYYNEARFSGHSGPVVALIVHHVEHAALLYSASQDNTIRAWDMDTLSCVHIFDAHAGEVRAMELCQCGAIATVRESGGGDVGGGGGGSGGCGAGGDGSGMVLVSGRNLNRKEVTIMVDTFPSFSR